MRAMIFVILFLAVGCTSSVGRINDVREAAPEWYKERRVELAGQGYPRIADVPRITRDTRPGQRLDVSQAATLAAFEALLDDPRNAPVNESAEEMRAWATEKREAIEAEIPVPDFLTDEEIEALRAIFDTPRGRL
ncbi:MAG: hypothetical protein AAGG45_08960 [Pseudomonadota bacterium]